MGAWQPLPDGLPSEVRHFVEQLRQLKDGTGLSLAALGARTAYSKSSWQRYLNAVQPPPRQAVAALCGVAGLAGAEAERHVVRWELAVEAWPRPTAEPARAAGEKGENGLGGERYEDDPTLPWWDEPPKERASGMNRLLLAAALLLVLVLLLGLAGAVASG
jgi:hypothetical protein